MDHQQPDCRYLHRRFLQPLSQRISAQYADRGCVGRVLSRRRIPLLHDTLLLKQQLVENRGCGIWNDLPSDLTMNFTPARSQHINFPARRAGTARPTSGDNRCPHRAVVVGTRLNRNGAVDVGPSPGANATNDGGLGTGLPPRGVRQDHHPVRRALPLWGRGRPAVASGPGEGPPDLPTEWFRLSGCFEICLAVESGTGVPPVRPVICGNRTGGTPVPLFFEHARSDGQRLSNATDGIQPGCRR